MPRRMRFVVEDLDSAHRIKDARKLCVCRHIEGRIAE